MINKTQEDLYLEYARVIKMAREYNDKHHTDVRPWECIKLGNVFRREHGHPGFGGLPEDYTFAIAILEGKPVFIGDRLWGKNINCYFQATGKINLREENCSWTPPQKKRTFMLNGVELPCPVDSVDGNYFVHVWSQCLWFKTQEESNAFGHKLYNLILTEARDKE